jgi:hypothetical protein
MHAHLARLVRLGLPTVAVLALALAGCGDPAPAPAAPPAAPASPSVPTFSTTAGSDGLTVRYLAADGSVKTVRVEDFPR